MTKAARYTKIHENGKVIAKLHEGYINFYTDYNNGYVRYFIYRSTKESTWYAVDIDSGMAITRAKNRKDLVRLDYTTAERLYAVKKSDDYKEMVNEFTLLVAEAELKRQECEV